MRTPGSLLLLLFTALDVGARTEAHSQLLTATMDASKTGPPLSPYLLLNITGAALSGGGTLWRLASAANDGQSPDISSSAVDSILSSLTLSRLSVSIYELPVT